MAQRRRRRDSGKILEGQILIAAAVAATFIGGAFWKPWGYLAGVALLAVIVTAGLTLGFLGDRGNDKALRRILDIVEGKSAAPDWPEFQALIRRSGSPPEQLPKFVEAARRTGHPARIGFAHLMLAAQSHHYPRLSQEDELLADCVLESPDHPGTPELVEHLVKRAAVPVGLNVARHFLAREGAATTMAARQILYRGTGSMKVEAFADLLREQRARIDALITDPTDRKYLEEVR